MTADGVATNVAACGGTACTFACNAGYYYSGGKCIRDGGWSAWSGWGACTANGGGGCNPANYPQTRTRACNNPAPDNGGAPCTLDAGATCTAVSGGGCLAESSTQACAGAVPVGSGSGTFCGTWGCVTSTWYCGGFNASCNPGAAAQVDCNYNGCAPVVAGRTDQWTEQSNVGGCSCAANYGVGSNGQCDPKDACGYPGGTVASCSYCIPGQDACYAPVAGGWSGWSACSQACNGTQTRTCTNPTPAYGGADCSGVSSQSCSPHGDSGWSLQNHAGGVCVYSDWNCSSSGGGGSCAGDYAQAGGVYQHNWCNADSGGVCSPP